MPPGKSSSIPSSLTSKFLVSSLNAKNVSETKIANQSKRFKACLRCRKSKIKCDNDGESPCKKCSQVGAQCIYQYKVPSYSQSQMKSVAPDSLGIKLDNNSIMSRANNASSSSGSSHDDIQKNSVSTGAGVSTGLSVGDSRVGITHSSHGGNGTGTGPGAISSGKHGDDWKHLMENRLENVGDALNNILGFLKGGKFSNGLPNPEIRHSMPGPPQPQPQPHTQSPAQSQPQQHTQNNALNAFSAFDEVYGVDYDQFRNWPSAPSGVSSSMGLGNNMPANVGSHAGTGVGTGLQRNTGPVSNVGSNMNNLPVSEIENQLPMFSEEDVDKLSNMLKHPLGSESSFSLSPLLADPKPSSVDNLDRKRHSDSGAKQWHTKKQKKSTDALSDSSDGTGISAADISHSQKTTPHTQKQRKQQNHHAASSSTAEMYDGNEESHQGPGTLREIVSYSMFEEIFVKFCEDISPQLFGFDVSKFDPRLIYVKCDLFVCLVCLMISVKISKFKHTIFADVKRLYLEKMNDVVFKANGSQPSFFSVTEGDFGDAIDSDSEVDQVHAEYDEYMALCKRHNEWNLFTRNEKKTELAKSWEFKLFFNITSLCIASFWFENSTLLFGAALQLAMKLKLNEAYNSVSKSDRLETGDLLQKNKNVITKFDKLKLWYLLFIADSQLSFLGKKARLMSSKEPAVKSSRSLLLQDKVSTEQSEKSSLTKIILKKSDEKTDEKTLNEKLICNAATYKDLELVSQLEFNQALALVLSGNAWDILPPEKFGIPWKTNLELDKWMVNWTCLLTPIHQTNTWSIKSMLLYYNFAKMQVNNEFMKKSEKQKDKVASYGNTDQSAQDEGLSLVVNDNLYEVCSPDIASAAAKTFVQAMINDKDIVQYLSFAPLHIFVMAYHAALVLMEFEPSFKGADDLKEKAEKYFENLVLVRQLIKVINENLPVDRDFGLKLTKNLRKCIEQKYKLLKKIAESYFQVSNKIKEIDENKFVNELDNDELKRLLSKNKGAENSKNSIVAWPGTNPDHP